MLAINETSVDGYGLVQTKRACHGKFCTPPTWLLIHMLLLLESRPIFQGMFFLSEPYFGRHNTYVQILVELEGCGGYQVDR